MRQNFWNSLNFFASFRNLVINPLILSIERQKPIWEHFSHIGSFTKYLSRKSFNLLNFPWASCLLFDGQIVSKLILVLFSQEIDKEFTSSQNFRFHNTRQKLLIIHFLFIQLFAVQFFLLIHLVIVIREFFEAYGTFGDLLEYFLLKGLFEHEAA